MTVKNLAQFKKAIQAKTPFEIVKHYIHPDYTGQKRIPNVIQTNGFYSAVVMPDGSENADWNNGKGLWYGYEKASCYEFSGDVIKAKTGSGKNVFDIRFVS